MKATNEPSSRDHILCPRYYRAKARMGTSSQHKSSRARNHHQGVLLCLRTEGAGAPQARREFSRTVHLKDRRPPAYLPFEVLREVLVDDHLQGISHDCVLEHLWKPTNVVPVRVRQEYYVYVRKPETKASEIAPQDMSIPTAVEKNLRPLRRQERGEAPAGFKSLKRIGIIYNRKLPRRRQTTTSLCLLNEQAPSWRWRRTCLPPTRSSCNNGLRESRLPTAFRDRGQQAPWKGRTTHRDC